MAKSIIKELGIVILLLIAISLILAIVFYDYIPNSKTVPIKIQAYNIPEDIKKELEDSTMGQDNIVKTYYIDSTDLNAYESTKDYNKGKANPFADYTTTTSESTNTNNSTQNSTNSTRNNTVDNNSNDDENYSNDNEVYITTPGKNY